MRFALTCLAVMLAAVASAQPPFLFTPHTRLVEPVALGWRVDLGDGDVVEVTGGGERYTARVGWQRVAEYRLTASGWVESPGGRTWRKDAIGRWHTGGGRAEWTLTPRATGFELEHPGGRTSWYGGGHGLTRH